MTSTSQIVMKLGIAPQNYVQILYIGSHAYKSISTENAEENLLRF
jgi:hypothetical protein